MVARYPPVRVRVWGEFACFTNPGFKVERVTYPVMTPSAARGILESIFWKPEFRWHIESIAVLNPITYMNVVRNEVKSKASERAARGWEKHGGGYDAPTDRTQRHTIALRDVAYDISAHIILNPHATDDEAKYRDQFRRRVAKGQCFSTPYLGCREWSAAFAEPTDDKVPIDVSMDLGMMLWDLRYTDTQIIPQFFSAYLQHGVLTVPELPTMEVHDVA